MIKELKSGFIHILSDFEKMAMTAVSALAVLILSLSITSYDYIYQRFLFGTLELSILSEIFHVLYLNSGYLGVILTLIFSITFGVLFTNMISEIREKGIKSGGYLGSSLPGIVAGSCAACGATLLPILGGATASIIFPFGGNFWRVLAVAIILASLYNIKREKKCSV